MEVRSGGVNAGGKPALSKRRKGPGTHSVVVKIGSATRPALQPHFGISVFGCESAKFKFSAFQRMAE